MELVGIYPNAGSVRDCHKIVILEIRGIRTKAEHYRQDITACHNKHSISSTYCSQDHKMCAENLNVRSAKIMSSPQWRHVVARKTRLSCRRGFSVARQSLLS